MGEYYSTIRRLLFRSRPRFQRSRLSVRPRRPRRASDEALAREVAGGRRPVSDIRNCSHSVTASVQQTDSGSRSFCIGGVSLPTRARGNTSTALLLAAQIDASGMSLADGIARCRATGAVSKHPKHQLFQFPLVCLVLVLPALGAPRVSRNGKLDGLPKSQPAFHSNLQASQN